MPRNVMIPILSSILMGLLGFWLATLITGKLWIQILSGVITFVATIYAAEWAYRELWIQKIQDMVNGGIDRSTIHQKIILSKNSGSFKFFMKKIMEANFNAIEEVEKMRREGKI